MRKYSCTNTIHESTRITQHTNTLLDPILVSGFRQGDVLDSGAIGVEKTLSEHKCTYIYLKSSEIQNKSYERNVRLYKDADFDKLNTLIRDTDWNLLINNASDIDQAENNFTTTISTFYTLLDNAFLKKINHKTEGQTLVRYRTAKNNKPSKSRKK